MVKSKSCLHTQAARKCDLNTISMSIVTPGDETTFVEKQSGEEIDTMNLNIDTFLETALIEAKRKKKTLKYNDKIIQESNGVSSLCSFVTNSHLCRHCSIVVFPSSILSAFFA